jgi:protein O-mannosyl-transferase
MSALREVRGSASFAGMELIGAASQRRSRRAWLIRAVLVGVTIWVFSPLLRAQFLQWDDGANLFENPRMLPPGWANCAYYFGHESLSLYIPVTYVVWSGLATVAQEPGNGPGDRTLHPAVFHGANIAVHALAVVVVFNILRLLVGDLPAAAGALVFAIHPVQAETVGWVSGMKDLLAGLFGFVAIWQYLLCDFKGRMFCARYAMASVAFVLAMLSKPSAAVTPLIAGILVLLLMRRPFRRVAAEMGLWVILSIVTAVVAMSVQPASFGLLAVPGWSRPLIAADAMAFYLYKLALPLRLCLDYGRTPSRILNAVPYYAYWTWIFPLGLFLILWRNRRRWPRVFAAALVFVAGLLPVLGLIRFNYQGISTVTDHYLYAAMLGPALAVGSVVHVWRRWFGAIAIIAGVLVIWAVLCHEQTRSWLNDRTAFGQATYVNPRSWVGHHHLWRWDMDRGEVSDAETEARGVIAGNPDSVAGYSDLADSLVALDRWQEAAAAYERAIRIAPDDAALYNNLASLYGSHGEPRLAIPLYRKALELKPGYSDAVTGLATALRAETGRKR